MRLLFPLACEEEGRERCEAGGRRSGDCEEGREVRSLPGVARQKERRATRGLCCVVSDGAIVRIDPGEYVDEIYERQGLVA